MEEEEAAARSAAAAGGGEGGRGGGGVEGGGEMRLEGDDDVEPLVAPLLVAGAGVAPPLDGEVAPARPGSIAIRGSVQLAWGSNPGRAVNDGRAAAVAEVIESKPAQARSRAGQRQSCERIGELTRSGSSPGRAHRRSAKGAGFALAA